MADRKRITSYGRRGRNLVRVFAETVGGRRYVRAQWSEAPGQPLVTESWPHSAAAVKEARAFAEGVADRLAAGGAPPPPDRTVRELADAYVLAEGEAWAPATRTNFRWRWGRFEAFLGRHTLARLVTTATLDEWRATMQRAGVATNQRALAVGIVKAVFRFAAQPNRKLLATNPLADYRVKLAKGEKRAEVPEWTPAEVRRQRAQLAAERAYRRRRGWRLAAAVDVAATQGPRQGALFHLQWADVNLSGATVRHPTAADVVLPPRSVWWNPAHDKLGAERVQPLSRAAVRALRLARVWRARDDYRGPWVFYRPGAGLRDAGTGAHSARAAARAAAKPDGPVTYQTVLSALQALCRRAVDADGRPVRWVKGRGFHGYRKHAAGEVHRLTGSERAAADWIGDKSIGVVRTHYLKKRAEEQRAVAEGLVLPDAPAAPAVANRNATATTNDTRPRRGKATGAQVTTNHEVSSR